MEHLSYVPTATLVEVIKKALRVSKDAVRVIDDDTESTRDYLILEAFLELLSRTTFK